MTQAWRVDRPLTSDPGFRDLRSWVAVLSVIVAYTAVRIVLIPEDGHRTMAFTHDSGYLAIVAQSLLEGRGFVNPGHWLVLLHPEALPMPYHQANPLVPVLIAGLSYLFPLEPLQAGFVISALASGLLILGLVLLLTPYLGSPWKALPVGFFAALFPPLFEDSVRFLADSLFLALLVLSAAALVRILLGGRPHAGGLAAQWREWRPLVISGAVLGLAWLTRSQAILVLPAVLTFLVLRGGIWEGGRGFLIVVAAAFVVASPWLARQHAVWGDPFYSEAGHFLVQDLAAREFDGEVERYWHSTEAPPGVGEAILADPRGSLGFLAEGLPVMGRRYARTLGLGSRSTLLILALSGLAFLLVAIRRRPPRTWLPEVVSVAVMTLTTLLVFGIRPYTAEMRYFGLVTLAFSVSAALGGVLAWELARGARERYRVVAAAVVLGLVLGFWGGRVLPATVATHASVTRVDNLMTGYRALSRVVDERYARGAPVVVGMKPYFYTLATGASGLAIPESDDDFLRAYMERYGACFVFLKDFELRYWRPGWQDTLPDWLVSVAEFPDDREAEVWDGLPPAILFRHVECPDPGDHHRL